MSELGCLWGIRLDGAYRAMFGGCRMLDVKLAQG